MKIAFVGKGGSGKTTLAASFTRFLRSKKLFTIAIDADINVGLASALGIPFT
ncbi:MAG: ATP-binding protein, partial [Candidatus Gracilibacteria bacterium]|nr:ATP-binding protein [Candidatus Gracilibacteria bacterium]